MVSDLLPHQDFCFPLFFRSVLFFWVAEYFQNYFHIPQISPRFFALSFESVEQVSSKKEILRLPELSF